MPTHYLTLRTNDATQYDIGQQLLTFNLPSSFYNKIKGDCYVSCIISTFERGSGTEDLYYYFDLNPFNSHNSNNEDNYVLLSKVSALSNLSQYLGGDNIINVKISQLKNTIKLKVLNDKGQGAGFFNPQGQFVPYNLLVNPCLCVLKFETKDETKQLQNYNNTLYKTLV